MPTGASATGRDITDAGSSRRDEIVTGTSIEVRARFDGCWSAGFEVADTIDADSATAPIRYRVRRMSDGEILPVLFAADDIQSASAPRRR